MSDLITLFKQENLNTASIDHYTYQAVQALDLAYPLYSKIVLASIENIHHQQSILFKSDLVRGFRFEDEDNAKKVRDFLSKNLRSQKEQPISFLKFIKQQLFHHAIFNSFHDQFVFLGKEPAKMYPLSPKYLYVKKDYSKWYQIIPNSDFQNYNDVGNVEDNTDFTKNMRDFVPFGSDNTDKQQITEFAGLSSTSDYYPDIPYIDEIDDAILVNRLIGSYERSWIKNNSNFKQIMALMGIDSGSSLKDQQTKDAWKRKIEGGEGKAGEMILIESDRPEGDIKVVTRQQIQKENFDATKTWNRDKIFTGHGTNPTILGIQTNESSLTSTSQAESLMMYLDTRGLPLLNDVSAHYDTVFKRIDPNYNTKLILETYQFKDLLKNAQVKAIQLQNLNALINAGNIEDFNSYKIEIKEKEYTPEQFATAVRNLSFNTGLDLGI